MSWCNISMTLFGSVSENLEKKFIRADISILIRLSSDGDDVLGFKQQPSG